MDRLMYPDVKMLIVNAKIINDKGKENILVVSFYNNDQLNDN